MVNQAFFEHLKSLFEKADGCKKIIEKEQVELEDVLEQIRDLIRDKTEAIADDVNNSFDFRDC